MPREECPPGRGGMAEDFYLSRELLPAILSQKARCVSVTHASLLLLCFRGGLEAH